MKYFLHDTNSFDDEKITELYLKFGYEGLGLFYTLLEKIAKQEKPVKTQVLKSQLKVGKHLEKCWNFMESLELICSNNGETFNEQLLNYGEKYQIKKEKTRIKVAEWRKNQEDKKNVTSYVPVSNLPKVKESKVKLSNIDKAKIFYDLELEQNNDEKYSQLVSFLFGNNTTGEPLENVLKIEKQIKYIEFCNLMALTKEKNIKLLEQILQLENYTPTKPYKSVNLTIQNWIKKQKQ